MVPLMALSIGGEAFDDGVQYHTSPQDQSFFYLELKRRVEIPFPHF